MKKSEFELVVSEGKKSVAEDILGSVFIGFFAMLVMYWIYTIFINPSVEESANTFFMLCKTGLPCLATGLYYSVTKTVLIDTDKDKLISRFHFGPFSRDQVSEVPDLEYISVFLDTKGYYQLMLWYKGNKRYKMFVFEVKEHAFKVAEISAQRLQLDVLDATERGNSKWLGKEA